MLASLCAALVAIAPCACGRPPALISHLHFPAAVIVFAILGYFCLRFRETAVSKTEKYPEAKNRVHVYTLCLFGMVVCALMAAGYAVASEKIDGAFPDFVFWLEALGLVSFGVAWLSASRTLPLITNPRERFHILEGSAREDQASAGVDEKEQER